MGSVREVRRKGSSREERGRQKRRRKREGRGKQTVCASQRKNIPSPIVSPRGLDMRAMKFPDSS